MLASINEWVLGLGADYGVNPYVFATIYLGAIPFFLASIAWLVRNARAGKPTALPALTAGLFFVSAYLYLGIFGEDIPFWVWILLGALVTYGGYTTIRDTRRKIARSR
jgi:hypothetical protein